MQRILARLAAKSAIQLGAVTSDPAGTGIAAAAGTSVIPVDDAAELAGSGRLDPGTGQLLDYQTVTVADDTGVTGAFDQVGLVDVLVDDVAAGIFLGLVDAYGDPVVVWRAVVELADSSALTVDVDPTAVPLFRDGQRDAAARELVELERDDPDPDGLEQPWVLRRPGPWQAPAYDLGFASDDPVNPAAVTSSLAEQPDAWAGAIPAPAIGSGELGAEVTVAGRIISGGVDGQGTVETNTQGQFTSRGDGSTRTALPNDPDLLDHFRGHVDAVLLSSEGAVLGGTTEGASGGQLRGRSAIAGPSTPPTVQQLWRTYAYAGPQAPSNKRGLAARSPSVAYTLIVRQRGAQPAVAGFDPGDSTYENTHKFDGAPVVADYVAALAWSEPAGNLVTLESVAGIWKVRYWDPPSGAGKFDFVDEWDWTDGVALGTGLRPALTCRDAAGVEHLTIAQAQPDGTVTFWIYDDRVPADTFDTAAVLAAGDLAGIADLVDSYTLAAVPALLDANGAPSMAVIDVAGTPGADLDLMPVGWGNPVCAGIAAEPLNPARTWYLSAADQSIIDHSDPAELGYYWAEGSYRHISDGLETLPSPPVRFTKTRGAQLMVACGSTPAGASFVVYLAAGASPPANADFWLQAPPLIVDQISLLIPAIVLGGTANPLTAPTWTTGTPFTLVSEDGSVALDLASYSNLLDLAARMDAVETGGGGSGSSWDVLDGGDSADETGWGLVDGGTDATWLDDDGTGEVIDGGTAA